MFRSARTFRPTKPGASAGVDMFSQFATKQDLQQHKSELKYELTVRLGMLIAAAVTLLFGMLKAF